MDSIVSPHPALAQGPRPKVRDERRRCLTDCSLRAGRPFLLLSLCGSPVPLTCGATATAAASRRRRRPTRGDQVSIIFGALSRRRAPTSQVLTPSPLPLPPRETEHPNPNVIHLYSRLIWSHCSGVYVYCLRFFSPKILGCECVHSCPFLAPPSDPRRTIVYIRHCMALVICWVVDWGVLCSN
jgi:hypothetical protein